MSRRTLTALTVLLLLGVNMATAPLSAAWGRRMANTPGPLMPGGVAKRGVPLLPDEFGPDSRWGLLIGPGADPSTDPGGWPMVDVSTDVLDEREIRIVDGRLNEQGQGQPAQLTFTLKNFDGDYTPRRQESPHFPYMKVGLPVEVFVDTGASGEQSQFTGFVDSIRPTWDVTGRLALVEFSARGVLNRLDQGTPPSLSPMQRAFLRSATPDYLWTLEDADDATEAAEANGGPGMTVNNTGVTTFGVESTDLAGVERYVTVTNTGGLTASAPALPNTRFVAMSYWAKLNSASTDATILLLNNGAFDDTGTVDTYTSQAFASGPPGFTYKLFDSVPTNLGTLDSGARHDGGVLVGIDPFDGAWHNVFVTYQQSGTAILGKLWVDGLLADQLTISGQTLSVLSDAMLTSIETGGGTTGTVTFSAFAIYSDPAAANTYGAGTAWVGEGCWTRFLRLLEEEGTPGAISTGATSGGRPMGPQPTGTIVDLLRQCEAVDGGVMVDG